MSHTVNTENTIMIKSIINFHDLTQQAQTRVIRRRTTIRKNETVTISKAYLSYFDDKLTQDVRIGNNRGGHTIMWNCNSAAFTFETESNLPFDFLRKKVQVRMVNDALLDLLGHDVYIRRVAVGEQYVEDGETKQEITATCFDVCWTIIWNCRKVCFEMVNQEIGQ